MYLLVLCRFPFLLVLGRFPFLLAPVASIFSSFFILIKGGQPPKVESVKSLFDKTNVHLFG